MLIEEIMRNLDHNRSADVSVSGAKGSGKSMTGLSICSQIDEGFDLNKQMCFTLADYKDALFRLKPKKPILLDETGTDISGTSNRASLSGDNRRMSDIWQLNRPFRIPTIMITLDFSRVDLRIRGAFPFQVTPVAQLSDEDTNGNGLAVECICTKTVQNMDGSEKRVGFKYGNKPVKSIIFPLPDASLIREYNKIRQEAADRLLEEFEI